MQTTLLVLQIPDSPSVALPDQRIAGRGELTAAGVVEVLVNRAKTRHHGFVSGLEPTEPAPRYRRPPTPRPTSPTAVRRAGGRRGAPCTPLARTHPGEQLAAGVDGADDITGTNTTALRPTLGRGQLGSSAMAMSGPAKSTVVSGSHPSQAARGRSASLTAPCGGAGGDAEAETAPRGWRWLWHRAVVIADGWVTSVDGCTGAAPPRAAIARRRARSSVGGAARSAVRPL